MFLLISPPFVPFVDQDDSLLASIDVAFSCGASVVSLIPTRTGNGALEALADDLLFRPPTLEDIERSFAAALQRSKTPSHGLRRGDERLFVDLWDLERFRDLSALCGGPLRTPQNNEPGTTDRFLRSRADIA